MVLETRAPLDLAVFASYHHRDHERVARGFEYLKRDRFFDLWVDRERLEAGSLWRNSIETALTGTVQRGGYVAVFWSALTANSPWVASEVARVGDPRHVILALLDDAPVPPELRDYQRVQLYGDAGRPENHRWDDLVVRLYWLIHRNTEASAH